MATQHLFNIKKICGFFFFLMLIGLFSQSAAGSTAVVLKVAARYVDEALDVAAKVSGVELKAAARQEFSHQLLNLVSKHQETALLAVRRGGLEMLAASRNYGDDVIRFAAQASAGARALALLPQEILPLARRIGVEVLELEGKAIGLSTQVVRLYGDDAVGYFGSKVTAEDAVRLIGFAKEADTPATRELLLSEYKRRGGGILSRLDWKQIMAYGLSASMIVSAYKVSDGVEEGLKTVAHENPQAFENVAVHTIDQFSAPIVVPVLILGTGGALILLFRFWLHNRRKWQKKNEAKQHP